MKRYLVLTALCLMALVSSANGYRGDDDRYKYEEKKIVEKNFDVNADPILEMNGKYSDFIITAWDKQQIDFKVTILVKSNNNDKLKAKINSIDIDFNKIGNKVIAETVFGEYPYNTFNGSITIKYYVNVPKDVFMELDTKYGDIMVDTVYKRFEVDIKYGDLMADNLLDISSIDIKYGNININNAKNIDLELDYGDAKITKCDYIKGALKYSKIFITELGEGKLENKYSDARIEKADIIDFDDNAYSDLKVRNITNRLDADIRYTDLSATVTSLSPIIDIDGQYSDMVLYINENASFDYSLKSSYGDIVFKGFFDAKTIANHGTYGSGELGRIDITTRYGDVDIIKNK